jgi:threonine aldolase
MFAAGAPKNECMALCTRFLSDHARLTSAQTLQELADYCERHAIGRDVYGSGDFLNAFEARIAKTLGMAAGVFMPSGTMAQQIALRIWADRAQSSRVAFHSTSHLEANEEHAYRHIHHLEATLLGGSERLLVAPDILACDPAPAAVLVELPMRRLGGILPSWGELIAIKDAAREKGARLHLDGARLWECAPFYQRTYAEICRGFDSVYVSFYKGLGGMCGSMLLGPEDFIAEARIWLRRHGGNLYQLMPYVVSAQLGFEKRIGRMESYSLRARQIAKAVSVVEGIKIRVTPQSPLIHLLVTGTPEALTDARDRIALEDGFWLAGRFFPTEDPEISLMEVSVGDCALALSDSEIVAALRKLTVSRRPE